MDRGTIMKKGNEATRIDDNISKYLFIQFPCPNCGHVAGVSLYMIHTHEWVVCPQCNKWFLPHIEGKNLPNFVQSFDLLHEQLRKIGFQLFLPQEQMPTIYSQKDKP